MPVGRAHAGKIIGNIVNFTNVQPILQITTSLKSPMILLLADLDDQPADPPGEVIVVTAPAGSMDNYDAQRIRRDEFARGGAPNLLAALDWRVPGLSLSAAQGNPWQLTIVFRGFSASPLLGGAQWAGGLRRWRMLQPAVIGAPSVSREVVD